VSELLGAIGLAWPRLLLYPGGLFALVASRALAIWLARCGGTAVSSPARPAPGEIFFLLPPLVAIAMMPLAPARSFPFGLDLAITLALLEWPRVTQGRGLDRAALLREYGPLLIAATLMGEAVGGLELTRLLQTPAPWLDRALLGAGAVLWALSLPRLIAAGPQSLAGQLRALGLLLIPALPLLGALAAASDGLLGNLAGWLLPPGAMLATAGVVGALVRLSIEQ
jgi:hypothetical protein